MPTTYEGRVEALKARLLDALASNTSPSEAGVAILAALKTPTTPLTATQSSLLAHAILATVLDIASKATHSGVSIAEYRLPSSAASLPAFPHLIDATLFLATKSPPAIDPGLPATCIEVAVEVSTNAECESILGYLDSRLTEFKRPTIMSKSNFTILRTCTLLLKRLSKSHNASLCGRVLLFLAKFLPLTERSGVNLLGAFHSENVTPIEDVEQGALDSEGNPIDIEFYKTFWGLLRWCSNPPSALGTSAWADLSKAMATVLTKFSTVPVTVTEAPPPYFGNNDNTKEAGGASVKYLSSARLLSLQLRDATFRRHILIQCLILLAWIEQPALKGYEDKGAKGQALEELQALQSRVLSTLQATPDKGKGFADAVQSVMASDAAWVTWKQAGCPPEPLQVAPLKPPEGADVIDPAPLKKRPKPSSDAVYGIRVGIPELDRLWNLTEDNLSTLGADDRGGFKTLRQLMEPVIDEIKEDDAFKASKNQLYSWKTLRMVARDSLPAFASAVRRGGDLTVAARALYPDEVPPEEAVAEKKEEKEANGDLKNNEQENRIQEQMDDEDKDKDEATMQDTHVEDKEDETAEEEALQAKDQGDVDMQEAAQDDEGQEDEEQGGTGAGSAGGDEEQGAVSASEEEEGEEQNEDDNREGNVSEEGKDPGSQASEEEEGALP